MDRSGGSGTMGEWMRKKRALEGILFRAREASKYTTPFERQARYEAVRAAEEALERHQARRPR